MRFPLPVRAAAAEPLLECHYYDQGRCRSCTLIETPQDEQLAAKQARAEEALAPFMNGEWLEPGASGRETFRNKVKLVVTGTAARPKLGILGPDGGQDLRDCPLPTPGIQLATPALAQFVSECGFHPYDPVSDRGVLKYVIVTESPSGELMVRFVARRRGVQGMLFKKLARLRELLPAARVVSLNVQPERKAVIEGEEEIVISDESALPMRLEVAGGELTLNLRPKSFFQTNTEAAQVLYSRAVEWVAGAGADVDTGADGEKDAAGDREAGRPATVWDLYCGVGGFALALASAGMNVVGVEAEEQAVEAARESAEELAGTAGGGADAAACGRADVSFGKQSDPTTGVQARGRGEARFVVTDATAWAGEQGERPDVVVVNPPRRGIGPELAEWIARSGVETVLYSSCNVRSLAKDVAAMGGFDVVKAQVVDMFPHTEHFETVRLLRRACEA